MLFVTGRSDGIIDVEHADFEELIVKLIPTTDVGGGITTTTHQSRYDLGADEGLSLFHWARNKYRLSLGRGPGAGGCIKPFQPS